MCIYLNISAKFHPDLIWNDGGSRLGFFEERRLQQQEKQQQEDD